jgi:hypothetical protein
VRAGHLGGHPGVDLLSDRQRGDYDPVFLDWVFWWYLATVELTDRLLARQDAEQAP